jgi:hypothetical protein
MMIDFGIEKGERRFGPKRVVLLRGFRRSSACAPLGAAMPGLPPPARPPGARRVRDRPRVIGAARPQHISISARQSANTPKGRVPTGFRPSAGCRSPIYQAQR